MAALFWTVTSIAALCFTDFCRAQIVSGPPTYTVLSGPLTVSWSLQPGKRVITEVLEIYKASDDSTAVVTVPLQPGSFEGAINLECGLLFVAGEYFLQLTGTRKNNLARSKAFAATWPKISVALPDEHVAQTLPHLQASITIGAEGPNLCQPRNGGPPLFWVELWQAAAVGVSSAEIAKWLQDQKPSMLVPVDKTDGQAAILIHSAPTSVANLTRAALSLHCGLFDVAGYYQMAVVTSNRTSVIATSNVMTVSLGSYYRLTASQASIFPCVGPLEVHYTRTTCPSPLSREDVVRLFALRSAVVPGGAQFVYLYERRASSAGSTLSMTSSLTSTVKFACNEIIQDHMDNLATETYCFKYFTMTSHGAPLVEQSALCLPINSSVSPPIDGQWSDWTGWSSCSSRCSPGRQHRYRYCDSPAPSAGGRLCQGNSAQWQSCGQPCTLPVVPSFAPVAATGNLGGTASGGKLSGIGQGDGSSVSSPCSCGCKLLQSSGTIIFSSLNPCVQLLRSSAPGLQPITWLIEGPPSTRVAVAVASFVQSASCSMRIRDGSGVADRLLATSSSVEFPANVTSTGSVVQLELSLGFGWYGSRLAAASPTNSPNCAFLARYESYNNSVPANYRTGEQEGERVATGGSSEIIIVIGCATGGGLTVVAIAITVSVCIYQKRYAKSKSTNARSDVKDGAAVLEADDCNINHLNHQVHSGRYVHFKHDVPLERLTPCDDQSPAAEQGAREKRRRSSSEGAADGNGVRHGMMTRSTTLPNPREFHPIQLKTHSLVTHPVSMNVLPDPYHICPEDFVHPADLLHSSRRGPSAGKRAGPRAMTAANEDKHRQHKSRHRHDNSHKHGSSGRKVEKNTRLNQPGQVRPHHRKQSRQPSSRRKGKAIGGPEEETLLALSGASSSSPAVISTTAAPAARTCSSNGDVAGCSVTAHAVAAGNSNTGGDENNELLSQLTPSR